MEQRQYVLPAQIKKQIFEFMELMDKFSALKRQLHGDRTAKKKLSEVAKKLDALCASLSAYYQSQATRWTERREEINKQVR